MKILKKPTTPQQTCKKCGCVFEVTEDDFMQSTFPSGETVCTCPFCKSEHKIIFGLQKSEEDGGKSNAIKKIDL